MTQEELDALMGGDVDLDALEEDEVTDEQGSLEAEDEVSDVPGDIPDDEAAKKWAPPATDENKVVHQLDDVTKESEEKASEIFDIIEGISSDLMEKEGELESVKDILNTNIQLFTTLNQKFPDVQSFASGLQNNQEAIEKLEAVVQTLQDSGDAIMNVMDIMQYQDIHRQKIERVINVMRALSKYMNSLFDSKVDDIQRVSSAKHIVGDSTNDLASNEDIEALLEQFGQ